MTVDFAFICDCADKTLSGKLDAMGILRHLMAPDFPALHPHLVLVVRFEIPSYEYNHPKQLSIVLVGPEGREIARVETTLGIVPSSEPVSIIEHVVHFQNLTFPEAGDYAFHIQVQGETKKSVALRLVKYAREDAAP
jgi:hypothetical protein